MHQQWTRSHNICNLSRLSLAPALPDTNRMRCFRLNQAQVRTTLIEVWTTRYIAGSNPPISLEEVAMLRGDTATRLLPLCQDLMAGKPVFIGPSDDIDDPGWWRQLQPCANFDTAINSLAKTGVEVGVIDYVDCQAVAVADQAGPRLPFERPQTQLLSIGFMQLIPYLSGRRTLYREISLDDAVQVIYCWL